MRRACQVLLSLFLMTWAAPVAAAQSSVTAVLLGNRMLPGEYEDEVTALLSQQRWANARELLDEGLEL